MSGLIFYEGLITLKHLTALIFHPKNLSLPAHPTLSGKTTTNMPLAQPIAALRQELNKLLADEDELKRRGEAAKNYVYANGGASGKIIQFIQEKRLLTN